MGVLKAHTQQESLEAVHLTIKGKRHRAAPLPPPGSPLPPPLSHPPPVLLFLLQTPLYTRADNGLLLEDNWVVLVLACVGSL